MRALLTKWIPKSWARLGNDSEGSTSVEYAAVLMLVLLAVIASVQFFGATVSERFDDSREKLTTAVGKKATRTLHRSRGVTSKELREDEK